MKSLIAMIASSILGVTSIYNVETNTIDNSNVIVLNNEEFVSLNDRVTPDNSAIFYINEDFAKKIDNSGTSLISVENNNSTVEEELILAGKYNFILKDIEYDGEIYGTSSSTLETISNKINFIMTQINDDSYFEGKKVSNNNSRIDEGVIVDSNWKKIDERRIDIDCTTDGEHFGDVSEWRTTFKLTESSDVYYAFINETFIKPNPDKTDYRTDSLVCKFKPDSNSHVQLRNYGPKFKNEDATISYSLNAGTSISSMISVSYVTLDDAPWVYDRGSLTDNYGEVFFGYLSTFENSGKYYEYNISQTYQACVFLTKTTASSGSFVTRQDRTISIQRDGFWSNKLAHFNFESEVVVNN